MTTKKKGGCGNYKLKNIKKNKLKNKLKKKLKKNKSNIDKKDEWKCKSEIVAEKKRITTRQGEKIHIDFENKEFNGISGNIYRKENRDERTRLRDKSKELSELRGTFSNINSLI